jgi:hypothetical protein
MKSRTIAAACAVAALLATAAPASAQSETIQPGVAIEADGSYCTLAWIFYGPGGQYGSTAAHCVAGTGQVVNLAEGALLGTLGRIGTVAFRGDENVPGRDYAFIKLDDAVLPRVSGALKGWPAIPTGISTSATAQGGDVIQFSGHGVGFSYTQPTQEQRKGVLNVVDDGNGEHTVIGPVISGDSGGPVADVTDGNKALGIVNTVGVGVNTDGFVPVHAGEGGVNLEHALADAAAHGFSGLTLRTAGG